MPRIPVVSRTMQVTICQVLMVDTEAGDTFTEEVVIPRIYATPEKALKVIKAVAETKEIKPVNILSSEVKTRRYYMLETEFIQQAKYEDPADVVEHTETKTETKTPGKKKHVNLVKPSAKGKRKRKRK